MVPFQARVGRAVQHLRAPACVGIDPHLALLPGTLRARVVGEGRERRESAAQAVRAFCFGVLDAIEGLIPICKPQVAFFEALGAPGLAVLEDVVAAARSRGILVLVDAKRGDIGSTAEAYGAAILDDDGPLGADAITLSPYLGPESMQPFVRRAAAGKGAFVLVRTSNPGAGVWQAEGDRPFAERVADWIESTNVAHLDSTGFGPIGAVVGATVADDIARFRRKMPATWLLLPGYGAQGAGATDVRDAFRTDGSGALVVSARGVLFPAHGDDGDAFREGMASRARAFVDDLRDALPAFR